MTSKVAVAVGAVAVGAVVDIEYDAVHGMDPQTFAAEEVVVRKLPFAPTGEYRNSNAVDVSSSFLGEESRDGERH